MICCLGIFLFLMDISLFPFLSLPSQRHELEKLWIDIDLVLYSQLFFFSLKRKRQKRKNKKVSKIRIEWLFYSVFIYAPLLFFFKFVFSPPLSEIHLSVCPFNTCTYLLQIYTAFSPFVTVSIEVLVTWIALVSLTRTRSCTCTVTNYIWLFSKCSNTQMNLSR